jgi:hypothetical protein
MFVQRARHVFSSKRSYYDIDALVTSLSAVGHQADMLIIPPLSQLFLSRGPSESPGVKPCGIQEFLTWMTLLQSKLIVLPSVSELLIHGREVESQTALDNLSLHVSEPRVAIPRPSWHVVETPTTPDKVAATGCYRCDFAPELIAERAIDHLAFRERLFSSDDVNRIVNRPWQRWVRLRALDSARSGWVLFRLRRPQ